MKDFQKLITDNWIFKGVFGVIAVMALIAIIFNVDDLMFFIFLYIPTSLIFASAYKKNMLTNSKNWITVVHTILFSLSFPGVLLWSLFLFVLKLIFGISKKTTPKFKL